MTVKLLTEHNLEFLCIKGGNTGSSESTLVKMLQCLKSHVAAHYCVQKGQIKLNKTVVILLRLVRLLSSE